MANVNESAVDLTWTASADAASYIIYRNGEEIANQAGTTYTDFVNEGIYSYSVVATDGNGRFSAPASVTISMGTVGVEESTLDNVSVYPNPVSSMLTISGEAEYTYTMFNGMGQMVANGKANGIEQINVSDMAKGIYFLHIATGTQVRVEKVVVK